LGVPLWSLADQQVELSDLRHDSSQMRERLGEADRAGKVFVALEQELRAMLAGAGPPEPRVRAAIQRLARAPESLSIEVLAAETGLTRQRLSRLFRDDVGYGPKRLARILRLQRAIRLLRARTGSALAEVALDAGYCDQPHMNGEFRALAGVAPLELAG
jgi:transcriptional regulator GlxA family with amidase domain